MLAVSDGEYQEEFKRPANYRTTGSINDVPSSGHNTTVVLLALRLLLGQHNDQKTHTMIWKLSAFFSRG